MNSSLSLSLVNTSFFMRGVSSTRIRIFLKTHLFYPHKNIRVHTRSVFENIPAHSKTLLHSNFAVRTSIKENRQSKCPCMIHRDTCTCSDTSLIDAVTSAFSKSSVFTRPNDIIKRVFKKILSGERFRKASFLLIKNAVFVWTLTQNGEKKMRLKKIRIRVDGAKVWDQIDMG